MVIFVDESNIPDSCTVFLVVETICAERPLEHIIRAIVELVLMLE